MKKQHALLLTCIPTLLVLVVVVQINNLEKVWEERLSSIEDNLIRIKNYEKKRAVAVNKRFSQINKRFSQLEKSVRTPTRRRSIQTRPPSSKIQKPRPPSREAQKQIQRQSRKRAWERLRVGMTTDQVESLLGIPPNTELVTWEAKFQWNYEREGKVIFHNSSRLVSRFTLPAWY